ncbi:MAG: efflux RND transporter periplasmic adaptor subunit [Bryobacteraceae bacterium]
MGLLLVVLCACSCKNAALEQEHPASTETSVKRVSISRVALRPSVRASGLIEPVDSVTILAPQVNVGGLTLTRIAMAGTSVKTGDIVAEFDRSELLERVREARARYEEATENLDQRKAQNRADVERRAIALQAAEAEAAKAKLELRKGPLLSEIDRLKNESRLNNADASVQSLKRSNHFREAAAAADLKLAGIEQASQKSALETAAAEAERLVLRAPLSGVVAQETIWSGGRPVHAQEGSRISAGEHLLRIFDPSRMEVRLFIGEADVAGAVADSVAKVQLDAYPGLAFQARFASISPVATELVFGSPVKTFEARFRLDARDSRLLPDLSVAADIEPSAKRDALVAPRTAVCASDGGTYVIRMNQRGENEKRAVKIGGIVGELVEIISGVEAGDQVLAPVPQTQCKGSDAGER